MEQKRGVRSLWLLVLAMVVSCGSAPDTSDNTTDQAGQEQEWHGTAQALSAGGPAINGVSPSSGPQGTTVTILGQNFSPSTTVAFNGIPSPTVTYVKASAIKAKVPAGTTTGAITITNGAGSVTGGQFSVLASPNTFAPLKGYPGVAVTLRGTGFTGVTSVLFGSVSAPFTVVSDTTITTSFPSTGVTGRITVVKPEGRSTTAWSFFKIVGISSFTPSAGVTGNTVSIAGGGFTGATSVLFGSTSASFTVISDSSIRAVAPTSSATNDVITVSGPQGTVHSSSVFFWAKPPQLRTFTPPTSMLPVTVQLYGSHLIGTTSVTLGGVSMPFTFMSDSRVDVMVPVGAAGGQFSVTNPAGRATSIGVFKPIADLCAGVVCAALDQCHRAGTCDATTGICSNPRATDGTACDDGSFCTQGDSCKAGSCISGSTNFCGATPVNAGMLAHYDAMATGSVVQGGEGSVLQWIDISGNGHDLLLSGSAPFYGTQLLNGQPAIDFNGGKQMTTDPFLLNSEVTVFAVIKHGSAANWGNIAHHGSRDMDWSIEQSGFSGPDTFHFQSANDNYGDDLTFTPGDSYLLAARITGALREFSATSLGGTMSNMAVGVTIEPGNKTMYVGTSDVGEASNETIGEIIYYGRSLSDAERDQMIAYLLNKWQI